MPGIYEYSVNVANAVTTVSVTSTTNSPSATRVLKKNSIDSSPIGSVVSLGEGTNIIYVEVTAQDTIFKKVYSITINRAIQPRVATLSTLTVSSDRGVEALTLESSTHPMNSYSLTVPYDISELSISAVTTDVLAAMSINSMPFTGPLTAGLKEGQNTLDIKVTAQDGKTVKLYRINVYRTPRSNITNLDSISISAGELSPEFNTNVLEYTVNVDNSVTSMNLTGILQDQKASVQVNGRADAMLNSLIVGSNVFDIIVIAEDNTVKNYVVTVIRAAASNNHQGGGGSGGTGINSGIAGTGNTEITVDSANPPEASSGTRTITVDVYLVGDKQNTSASQATIVRKIDESGAVKDEVSYTIAQAQEIVEKARETKQESVRILIPDAKDEVSQVDVRIPTASTKELQDAKINMEILTDNVHIIVPHQSMSNFEEDIYFRIVPVKHEHERREIESRAKVEKVVREAAKNQNIYVTGRPMTIETNLQSRPVTLILPLRDVILPDDPEAKTKFLENLVIYIEHSDGEKVLVKAVSVPYGTNNDKIGLKFSINKFSTFTILHMEGWKEYFASLEGEEEVCENYHMPYIKGYADNTFRPDANITRAEMAMILARNLGYDETIKVLSSYSDVKDFHWAVSAIEYVKAMKLMVGDGKGNFHPDEYLTRGEIAIIVARYKQLQIPAITEYSFTDTKEHWAASAIEAIRKEGIVNGYSDGTYRPQRNITRAEAVKIINRMFNRGPFYGVSELYFKDVPVNHWAFYEIAEAAIEHFFKKSQDGGEQLCQ